MEDRKYELYLEDDELNMLSRVLLSGHVGGNPAVRESLTNKVRELMKLKSMVDWETIDGEVEEHNADRVPSCDLLAPTARAD